MDLAQAMLAVAIVVVLVNAGYIGVRGQVIRSKYPEAGLPPATSLAWGTLIAGLIAIAVGNTLTPHAGAAFEPAWGYGVAGAGTATLALGWIPLMIDVRTRKLPTELTAVIGAQVVVTWFICWAATGFPLQGLLGPVVATLLWLAPLSVGLAGGQVGKGDVRLAPVLGFALGTMSVVAAVVGLALAFLMAGIAALQMRIRGAASQDRLALGPYMLVAAWGTWALGAVVPALLLVTGVPG